MSKAFKCDRCKNYYDPYKTTTIVVTENLNVDLCRGCTDILKKWLKEYDEPKEAADDKEKRLKEAADE